MKKIFYLVVLICVIYGCSGADSQTSEIFIQDVKNLIKVPLSRQDKDYTCGIASLQSVLYFYGKEYRVDTLESILKPTPNEGTNYRDIVYFIDNVLYWEGFRVSIKTDMTLEEVKLFIDQKKPIILLIQAWADNPYIDWKNDWDDGHYVVAIGYDENNMYFMDPSTLGNYTYIPIPEFLDRWHDQDSMSVLNHFGMLITREGFPIYNPDLIKRMF